MEYCSNCNCESRRTPKCIRCKTSADPYGANVRTFEEGVFKKAFFCEVCVDSILKEYFREHKKDFIK